MIKGVNVFRFNGKRNKTFIQVRLLKEAPEGKYKNDIVELHVKSLNDEFVKLMTPYEALIISAGLSMAVVDYEKNNKGGLLK